MARRQWALVVVLILINYIVFASLFNVVFSNRPSATQPTRTPLPTFTPAPPPTPVVLAPTNTPVPPPPTPTYTRVLATPDTATPESPAPAGTPAGEVPPTSAPAAGGPSVTMNENLNVRSGPGTNYDRVGSLAAGATVDIIGRNTDSSWWQIPYAGAPDSKGWISAGYGTARNTEGVPVVAAPPTPKSVAPTATPAPPPTTAPQFRFQPKGSYAGENKGLTRFMGNITDRAGNPVSGFFLYFTCGTFHVMSFPTGPSSVAPDWPPGYYSQYIASKELDCKWTMQVVMYKCSNWFDAQCTQFDELAPPDYFHTYAGHTVVTADWWCNWDCDKGMRR